MFEKYTQYFLINCSSIVIINTFQGFYFVDDIFRYSQIYQGFVFIIWVEEWRDFSRTNPGQPICTSQQSNPLFSSSSLATWICLSLCLGVMSANANPPPPAPVSLQCIMCFAVIAWIRSKEGCDVPSALRRPWFVSINCYKKNIHL